MNPARRILLGSLLLLAVLVGLLRWEPRRPGPATGASATSPARPLLVYCAAGLKGPVEALARDYERRYGVPVQLQFGGSGTLLSNLRVARQGDLFLAADGSYVDLARSNGVAAEVLPLARLTPVVVARRDRVPPLHGWEDLERPGITLALANPDAAAVGRQTRRVLDQLGRWAALESHVKVYKPTVNDIANDVKLGTVDAGIVWDATAAQYPELVAVRAPGLESVSSTVSAVVLNFSGQPTAALRFARFLGARDAGLLTFARAGFQVVRGDVWADPPEVLLYSGAVNRLAIEESLREFEEREGARVTRVYNGCGILTAQIRAGQRPDAYFACDVSFMTTVAGEFAAPVPLAETRLVILARPGNPRGLRDLADLARPGLALGVAHEQQSALGALTQRLLQARGITAPVMANVRVQTPTADLLVNQLRAGALDAAIVYAANASAVRQELAVVELAGPGALAIQPYAVGRNSDHAHLMERLLDFLKSDRSRARFEDSGFRFRPDEPLP